MSTKVRTERERHKKRERERERIVGGGGSGVASKLYDHLNCSPLLIQQCNAYIIIVISLDLRGIHTGGFSISLLLSLALLSPATLIGTPVHLYTFMQLSKQPSMWRQFKALNRADTEQDLLLMLTSNIRTGKNCDLNVGDRRAGLSIPEAADLLGLFTFYTEWCDKHPMRSEENGQSGRN